MTEINDDGLFLVEGGEVTHIHTSLGEEPKLGELKEYLEEWDLNLNHD